MNTANKAKVITEKQVVDLIGVQLDGYQLVKKIGEGAFSIVYQGENSEGDIRAFKVARSEALYGAADTGCYQTEALLYLTGAIGRGRPMCQDLLRKQFELMAEVDGLLVKAERFEEGDPCYLRMPLVKGTSLRRAISDGQVATGWMISLADGMATTFEGRGLMHGDIKPENILLTGSGAVLIDPGYFGSLQTVGGKIAEMRVTTRVYYPFLIANDIMAFGLILLEIVLGKNMLSSELSLSEIETTGLGSGLVEQIVTLERNHNYTWSAIARLGGRGPLAERLAQSPFDKLILKALGLKRLSDGALNTAVACASWADVAADLRGIMEQGCAEVC